MTIAESETVAARIHDAGFRYTLAITGGGSEAIGRLLRVPGGSRGLLEALVPYAAGALARFLGAAPEHFCAPQTARAMAMAAFWRALELAATDNEPRPNPETALGVACTASLASDRPKRGPHRVHVAIQGAGHTQTNSLELRKGARTRPGEEQIAAQLLLNALAEACGVSERIDLGLLAGEQVLAERTDAPREWQSLLLGSAAAVRQQGNLPRSAIPALPPPRYLPEEAQSQTAPAPVLPAALLPGAFNPLHQGHLEMAAVAGQMLKTPIDFEISIKNVDKPPLDYTEMALRGAQFAPEQTLWFTRAATFAEKAAVFPGAVFVVGADTIARIADSRYYAGDSAARQRAIETIAEHGCRFLVFGRSGPSGFATLAALNLPPELLALCASVPEESFRRDISSTELRLAHQAQRERSAESN